MLPQCTQGNHQFGLQSRQYQPSAPLSNTRFEGRQQGHVPTVQQGLFVIAANSQHLQVNASCNTDPLSSQTYQVYNAGIANEYKLLKRCKKIMESREFALRLPEALGRIRSAVFFALTAVAGHFLRFGLLTFILTRMILGECSKRDFYRDKESYKFVSDFEDGQLPNEFNNWLTSSSSDQSVTFDRVIQVSAIHDKVVSARKHDLCERKLRIRQAITCAAAVILEGISYIRPSFPLLCARVGIVAFTLYARGQANRYEQYVREDVQEIKTLIETFETQYNIYIDTKVML